ncbi:hypothetical protein F5Y15DRAFT_418879 [Xylariaceae sp. FL0016]|nr:hypothetical protein F5Y15DRAFT_418879 [Xylariaceae sp. FL0016]
MGRTEPTIVKPPASFRRDARAKKARATVNKVIPALLLTHPRAKRGIESSELIVDPPPGLAPGPYTESEGHKKRGRPSERDGEGKQSGKKGGKKGPRAGKKKKKTMSYEEHGTGDANPEPEAKPPSRGAQDTGATASPAPGPRITLRVVDTLAAAHDLLTSASKTPTSHDAAPSLATSTIPSRRHRHHHGHRIGILNMASPLSPGGGFLNGATSQEASLCMRTTLLPALRDEFYRLPEVSCVFSPDVLVFRSRHAAHQKEEEETTTDDEYDNNNNNNSDVLPKRDRFFVDVVSAAMPRHPDTEADGAEGHPRYARDQERELVGRKMRAVMRVFAAKGCGAVVLGAWGAGAYGNPVGEVARAWRKVLLGGGGGRRRRTGENMGPSSGGDGAAASSGGGGRGNDVDVRAKLNRGPGAGGAATWSSISHIVFAVKDAGLASAFAAAFGPELEVEEDGDVGESGHGDEDEDPVATLRLRELRDKILDVEAQIAQARSPHLRAGLDAVLTGLRKNLPEENNASDEHGEESEEEEEKEDAE